MANTIVQLLARYKADLPKFWEDEKYKWEAVQHFQDNWDIDAEDFGAMFAEATKKHYNLLLSRNYFPQGMIQGFAAVDVERTRSMFRNLYNESLDLKSRIKSFIDEANSLRQLDSNWKNHYQDLHAISVYLTFMYPERYFIYKYTELKNYVNNSGDNFVVRKIGKPDYLVDVIDYMESVRARLVGDEELAKLIAELTSQGNYYTDEHKNITTVDFVYYVGKRMLDKPVLPHAEDEADPSQQPKLQEETDKTTDNSQRQYWWLVAKPSIWRMTDMMVGDEQEYTIYNDAGHRRRIFQNFLNAREGDIVIGYEATPTKQIVALLQVVRANDGQVIVFRKTESLPVPIDYATIKSIPELKGLEFFQNVTGSFFKITEDEYNSLMDIIREDNPLKSEVAITSYTEEDFLNDVFIDREQYDRLKSLLMNKKNIILQGAPGVGKTFSAKRLAYSIMGMKDEQRIELVQFHQSYTYEDFIMGYKPNDEGGFYLKKGIFYNFCKKAKADPSRPYFFIIDEINRGNLSKIFGELMMLIENDYRNTSIRLAYNDEWFEVPTNVHIIGMMNTADRSLAMIDYALRRRFSFFEMKPGFDSSGFKKYISDLNNSQLNNVIDAVKELNETIAHDSTLGSGFCIGHSYFCNLNSDNLQLDNIIEYDIIPMLREYWFDNDNTFNNESQKLRDALK